MGLEQLTKLLDHWKQLASGLVLLVGAVVALHQTIRGIALAEWSWPELAFVAAIPAIAAWLWFDRRRRKVSRLVDPEVLRLDPRNPEHLFGRKEDLPKLLNTCSNPLVFLVSESGSGKSALMQAGIMQNAEFSAKFLPLYIDMSLLDWEEGPLRALRDGFDQALATDAPERGTLSRQSGPAAYAKSFSAFHQRTRRPVLLLLDQFDDYQANPSHRERFLPPSTRVWREASDIARENAFWRTLRQCLATEAVRVIVAAREEAAKGLESIRLGATVPFFDLPRLPADLAEKMLQSLAAKEGAIADPAWGWIDLRKRGDRLPLLQSSPCVFPPDLSCALGWSNAVRRNVSSGTRGY